MDNEPKCCKQLEESNIVKYDIEPYTEDYGPNVKPGWVVKIIGYDTGPGELDERIKYCPFCGKELN